MEHNCFGCGRPLAVDEASIGVLVRCACGQDCRPGRPLPGIFIRRPSAQVQNNLARATNPVPTSCASPASVPPTEPTRQRLLYRVIFSQKWYYRGVRSACIFVGTAVAKPYFEWLSVVLCGFATTLLCEFSAYMGNRFFKGA